jgi:hypothetical protein
VIAEKSAWNNDLLNVAHRLPSVALAKKDVVAALKVDASKTISLSQNSMGLVS